MAYAPSRGPGGFTQGSPGGFGYPPFTPGQMPGGVTPVGGGGSASSSGSGQSFASRAGGFLRDNWMDILGLGLGAYSAYQGNQAQGRADDLMARQLAFDEKRWAFGEPLRNMALQGLPQMFSPIDMGNHMYDSANPYAAARGPRASNATLSPLGAMGAPNFGGGSDGGADGGAGGAAGGGAVSPTTLNRTSGMQQLMGGDHSRYFNEPDFVRRDTRGYRRTDRGGYEWRR